MTRFNPQKLNFLLCKKKKKNSFLYYKNYIYYIHSLINYLYENSSLKCSFTKTIPFSIFYGQKIVPYSVFFYSFAK